MSKIKHLSKSASVGEQDAGHVRQHWSSTVEEVLVSQSGDCLNAVTVCGGAENGQFCYIGDVASNSITYHHDGRLRVNDVLLEVQGHCVAGYTLGDVVECMAVAGRNSGPVLYKTVLSDLLTKDLREFLNMRFQKGSTDHELQQIIRSNIYKRTVPCTTRPPRPIEINGVDYRFLTVDEFRLMEERGELLESGIFDDNHYGTPKPPKQPMPSSATVVDGEPTFHRSGSVGNIVVPGQHPSSDGKRQRNRSNVETRSADVDNRLNNRRPEAGDPHRQLVVQGKKSVDRLHSNGDVPHTGWNERVSGIAADQPSSSSLHPGSATADELPYGWERVDDPHYGVYYIDHINKRTQYENPVLKKKLTHAGNVNVSESPRLQSDRADHKDVLANEKFPQAYGDYRNSYFTRHPEELQGQFVETHLVKTKRGLGFTIVGGDDSESGGCEEFLQIKSVSPNSPAAADGKLCPSDVLVFVDDQCVLGYSHRNIINLFQSIPVGETVKIEVCRGYPLPFDPDDPNNEVITTVAVTAAADLTPTNNLLPVGVGWNSPGSKLMVVGHGVHVNADESSANSDTSSAVFQHSPKLLTVDIVRGPMGFGFTIADSVHGQRVKQLLDRPRCQGLMEGDLLVEINGRIVRDMKHTSVVEVLQKCPINSTASFLVQRGGVFPQSHSRKPSAKSPVDNDRYVKYPPVVSDVSAPQSHGNVHQTSYFPAPERGPELNRLDHASSRLSQREERQEPRQRPLSSPTNPLNEFNARFPYLPPSVTESSRVPPEVLRKPLQRGYSLHSDNVRNRGLPVDDPAVDSGRAVQSVTDYPFHVDYQQHDRSGALTRSFSNHTSVSERDKMAADQVTSARVRSKTPGPDFMRGMKPGVGGEEEMIYPARPSIRSKTPTFESSNKSAQSLRNRPPMSGTPDFIPASQYTGPQDGYGYPGDPNWASVSAQQAWPKLSSSSMSSTLHGSPYTDSMLGMKALNPTTSSWTESPSSNFSEPGQHVAARALHEEQFYEMPIYLRRLENGFGFRIIGGTEEGSQVSVGHVVPGGAADNDGHLCPGDEITYINGLCVLGASHRKVVQLMTDAAHTGHVTLRVRRKARPPHGVDGYNIGLNKAKFNYPYDVTLNRLEHEGFGFVLLSSSVKTGATIDKIVEGSPADRSGALHVGDRILSVNGIAVSHLHHEHIVNMIRDSGLTVVLTVGPPDESFSATRGLMSAGGDSAMMSGYPSQSETDISHRSEYSPYHAVFNQQHGPPDDRKFPAYSTAVGNELMAQSGASNERLYSIELQRGARGFGFSIRGGREFNNMPLFVLKIADGGSAHADGRLRVGDQIIEINSHNTQNMTHAEAIELIQNGNSTIRLLVKRTPTIRQPGYHSSAWPRAAEHMSRKSPVDANGVDSSLLATSNPWSRNSQSVDTVRSPSGYGHPVSSYPPSTFR